MPLGLSRKQSAPALLLCLSPSVVTDGSQLQWHRFQFVSRPYSAPPAVFATKYCLLCRDLSGKGNLDEKENDRVLTGTGRECVPIDPSIIKPAINLPHQTTGTKDENHQLKKSRSYRTGGGSLESHCNSLSQSVLGPPTPSLELVLLDLPIRKPSEVVSINQVEPIAPPPLASKRMSSRYQQAFRETSPPPLSPPECYLSSCDTNNSETQVPTNRRPWISTAISPRTSMLLKGTDFDCIPPDRAETLGYLSCPERCVVDFPRATLETAPGGSYDYCPLQQEQKDTNTSRQENLLNIINNAPQPLLRHRPSNRSTTRAPSLPTISAEEAFSDVESSDYSSENRALEKNQTSYIEGNDRPQSSSMEAPSIMDTGQFSNCQEVPKELESSCPRSVYQKIDTPTKAAKRKDQSSDILQKEKEATLKKSRLATWKKKVKLDNWLGKKKHGPPVTSHLSGGTNLETVRLKKSPSLLFRLWSPTTSKPNSEGTQHRQKKHSDEAYSSISRQATIHPPLQDKIAVRVTKDRERVLHEGGQLAPDVITNENTKHRNAWESLEQGVGGSELNIKDFSMLSPDSLPNKSREAPALNSEKERGVSWNGSIQEYAGSLGQVCPCGGRPVNDAFRSGTSGFSSSGRTATGIPSLACLKAQMGFSEEPIFEDSSLVADWSAAVQRMEVFSKAEKKLKHTGAVKHKRTKKRSSGPRSGTDCGKDGIGRSFPSDGTVVGDSRTILAQDTLQDYEDSDSESVMSGSSVTEKYSSL